MIDVTFTIIFPSFGLATTMSCNSNSKKRVKVKKSERVKERKRKKTYIVGERAVAKSNT